jgi:acyl carrier protein
MSADRVEEQIREFILKRPRGRPLHNFGSEDSLFALGVLDSMGVAALVAFCEECFGIEIADDQLVPENFRSVGAIARLVRGCAHAAIEP